VTGSPLREPAPRAVVWASVLVLLVTTAMLLWGAWRTGVSVDEPYHVLRLRNLFETGWYLLDDDLDGSVPGAWVSDEYVYAPVATLLMHAVCVVLGIEGGGTVSASESAYAVRHLVVALLGLLGAFAVAATGRLLMRSWAWGLVAAGTLMAVPMWPGLSMFDIKDVPAATGYSLYTLGLVLALRTSRGATRTTVASIAATTTGALLAVGTRPGLWTGLALGLVVLAWFVGGRDATGRVVWAWWRPAEVGAGLGLAYLVLWAAYPAMFSRPDRWLFSSAEVSSDYSQTLQSSTAYIPVKVLETMPSLLLLLGCLGCLAGLLGWRGRGRGLAEARILVIACQALALPAVALFRHSHLYDDLRQLLFACPAVALLLTLGIRYLLADLARSGSGVARRAVLGAWVVALLAPVAVQGQLFPYAYAYGSPLKALQGQTTGGDFWRTSFRELLPDVPRDEFVMCSPRIEEGVTQRRTAITGRPAALAGTDCRYDPISPLTPYADFPPPPGPEVPMSFIALVERGMPPGRNCEEIAQVTRPHYLGRQVLSTVARCELALTAYPGSGWEFQLDGAGWEFLLGGWTSSPSSPEVRMWQPFATLGFTLPKAYEGRSLRLELSGDAGAVPEMWVNNRPVTASATPSGWSVDLTAATVAAIGERRFVVTLAQPARGEPLRLAGVGIVPL
jgi:hypothetical protein